MPCFRAAELLKCLETLEVPEEDLPWTLAVSSKLLRKCQDGFGKLKTSLPASDSMAGPWTLKSPLVAVMLAAADGDADLVKLAWAASSFHASGGMSTLAALRDITDVPTMREFMPYYRFRIALSSAYHQGVVAPVVHDTTHRPVITLCSPCLP